MYLSKQSGAGALSAEQKIERRRLQKAKYYMLKKHVFGAMGNIIHFLEQSKLPEFDGIFDEDIINLFTGTNISRLIHAPLDSNLFKDQDNGYNQEFNRRLAQIGAVMVMDGSNISIEYFKRTHEHESEEVKDAIIKPIKTGAGLCKGVTSWERVSSQTLVYRKHASTPT